MERKPKRRLGDLGEALSHLEEALAPVDEAPSAVPSVPPVVQPAGWRQALPWALGTFLVGSLITGLAVWGLTRPDLPRLVRSSVLPEGNVPLYIALTSPDVAISPDGAYIAYLTDRSNLGAERLHVRPLDQFSSETLVAEGELNSPFFSPDSQSVGFYENQTSPRLLKRVSVQGGPTSTICEFENDMRGASWGADGTIIFASAEASTGLWRVPAVGGEPEQLTTPDAEQGELDHFWPEILPGGDSVLFTIVAASDEDSQIAVLSLDTGEQTVLVRGGSFPRYSPTGHLLYAAVGDVWAVRFDLSRLETVGSPVPVLEGVLTKQQGAANFSVSENGSLIYVPGFAGPSDERTLVWVGQDGREEELRAPPAPYEAPRVSPDGRYVAVEVRDPGNTDVWVYDVQRETRTRLTFDPGQDGNPLWSPDGRQVLFSSTREGSLNIYSKAADGTGSVERVTTSDTSQVPLSWSADGQALVIMDTSGGQSDLDLVSIGAENRTEGLIQTEFSEFHADVSPDGRWIAYVSNESGVFHIYVRPFPNVDDGSRWQISRDGGFSPVWAPDEQSLFFRTPGGIDMMVVAVDTEPTFNPGNPEVSFATTPYRSSALGRGRPWDIAGDGRFLMVREGAPGQETGPVTEIRVVQSWFPELERLVPVD